MPAPPKPRQGRRPVAVVSFAQADNVRRESHRNEVETLMPVFAEVFAATGPGITKDDIDFICSGSTDYLVGGPFSFVTALDAIGVYPPRSESHVEMDAAWALYEAWVALQDEGVDSALVYGFGKSSLGQLSKILSLQLDPYVMAPLWPDPVSIAALQARALLDAGRASESDFAAVAARCRRAALANPKAQVAYDKTVDELMAEEYVVTPLRRHTLPPITDGAAAVVLAAGTRAYEWAERPAWITGIDHRVETHALGARDLASSPSTARAGQAAGVGDGTGRRGRAARPLRPPGADPGRGPGPRRRRRRQPVGRGAGGQPPHGRAVSSGIGEAATRIMDGSAGRAVAHATSGPVLQHNLVAVLEGE